MSSWPPACRSRCCIVEPKRLQMNYTRLTHDTFYLTDEQLENSPSRKDGIDKDTEAELRSYGCTLVQEAGILLAFPQAVMATGQVLLHRFYCKRSMKHFNVKKVAATALWHGAKIEEVPEVSGHPRELLNKVMVAIDRCIARRETQEGRKLAVLDLHSKEAEEFRRSLIRYELEMLKAFGFITHVEHPHKLLLMYCQIMGLDQPHIGIESQEECQEGRSQEEGQEEGRREFCQAVWNVANDSLRTTLCVRHKGSVVACGIIFYTARKLKVPLPESPPWWTLFSVSLPQVCEVAATLHQLYKAPKPRFIPVCHQLLPSKPPTPAGAAAPADSATADTGATPLPGRPGGKPLDPSVRRTLGDLSTRVVGATPKQGEAGPGSSTPAAAASVPPSPQRSDAPGSARKRSRSPQGDEARKRHQGDSLQAPAAAGCSQQDQQQQQQPSRPDSAGGERRASGLRRGSTEPDRDRDRDRDRERSSKPSGRHQSHSRDRDRDRDRGRRRSSRSRSRDRGHGSSKGRGESRYDKGRPDRDREREKDRRHRDGSRERADHHRQQRRDRDREQEGGRRDGRHREDRRAESDKDRNQQQQQQQPSKDGTGSTAAATTAAAPAADGGSMGKSGKGTEQQQPGVGSNKGGFPPPPGSSSTFPPPPVDAAAARNGTAASTGKVDGTGSGMQHSRAKLFPPEQLTSAAAVQSPDSSRAAQPGGSDAAAKPPAAKPKPVAVRKKPPVAPGSADGSGNQGVPKQGASRVAVPSTEEAVDMEF